MASWQLMQKVKCYLEAEWGSGQAEAHSGGQGGGQIFEEAEVVIW